MAGLLGPETKFWRRAVNSSDEAGNFSRLCRSSWRLSQAPKLCLPRIPPATRAMHKNFERELPICRLRVVSNFGDGDHGGEGEIHAKMVHPDPWSLKKLLIRSQAPGSLIPGLCSQISPFWSADPIPLIPDPTYLVTTLAFRRNRGQNLRLLSDGLSAMEWVTQSKV